MATFQDIKDLLTGIANAIRAKTGRTAQIPASNLATEIANIPTGGDALLEAMFSQTPIDLVIPDGTTSIYSQAFYANRGIKSVTFPNSLTVLGTQCFAGSYIEGVNWGTGVIDTGYMSFTSSKLKTLTIPAPITYINSSSFLNCTYLTTVNITGNVTQMDYNSFQGCTALTTINLPASLTTVRVNDFTGCTALEFVTLENGWNCNNLDLSASTRYSAATIIGWLNALADRTGDTAYTLTIGATNLAKLSSADIAIATAKNWNLA